MLKLPLSQIRLPSWGWHHANEQEDEKLKASIKRFGQLSPLIVREVDEGYELIDGRRRYQLLQDEVWCLNKGRISEYEAMRIALSLEMHSEIDFLRLARTINSFKPDDWRELEHCTPWKFDRYEYFEKLSTWGWDEFFRITGLYDEGNEEPSFISEVPPEPTPVVQTPIQASPQQRSGVSAAQRLAGLSGFTQAPPVVTQATVIAQATTVVTQAPIVAPVRPSAFDMLQATVVPPVTVIEPPQQAIDPWSQVPQPALKVPVAPQGGIQFFGAEPKRYDWVAQEPPDLTGIDEIVLNFETDGLRWYENDRPVGVTVGTLDGQLKRFLPFRFVGGNLDETVVKRWAKEQLKFKRINGANIRFDIHSSRVWGVDLEEQGCTFSDVQHWAALIDEYRRQYNLDALVRDFLKEEPPPRVDESRMATYHAAEVAQRAEFQVEAVARLRDELWPELDRQRLQRVRQLEDDVIPVVCEMEKNAAFTDRALLRDMVERSQKLFAEMIYEVSRDLGMQMNPDKNDDWQVLFTRYGIPITQRTERGAPSFADDVLKNIDHPMVQLARRAGKLASLRSKFLIPYSEIIKEDGKLRFALHQLRGDEYGTVRGRFSMSGGGKGEPRFGANLQQVFRVNSQREAFGYAYDDPSHDDEIFLVRSLFIAETGEYLSADAQAIEYRLAAHFANALQIIEAYKADWEKLKSGDLLGKWIDFHKIVGDIIRPYKDLSRNIVKNANFCLVYNGKEGTLGRTLGVSRPEASQIYTVWHRMFPELSKFPDEVEAEARKNGFIETLMGRRARFRNEQELMWAHAAINYKIQGSAADILKKKAVELHAERKHTGFLMRQTVHDEFDGDSQQPETPQRVREILNRQSFPELKIPIIWEVETGKNWAEAH